MGLLTSGAGTVAGITGHDDAHTAMELFSGKQGAYELKASMVDTNGFTRAVSKVGGAAPSLIPALTVGRFAGWAGKFAGLSPQATQTLAMLVSSITAGGQSFGSVYHEAHEAHEAYVDAGMAEKEARRAALKPAIIGGLITAAMTQAGGANGVEAVFRGAGARELVKRTLWERAKMVGIDMTEEALEEGTDQLLQGIVGSYNHRRDLTHEQILDEAVEAAWIGGLLGGTVSGVQEGSQALWDKDGKLHEAVTRGPVDEPMEGVVMPSSEGGAGGNDSAGSDSTGPDGDIWKPSIGGEEYGASGTAAAKAEGQNGASNGDAELSFSMGTQPAMVRPIDNPTSNATLHGDEARSPKAVFRALTGDESPEESDLRGGSGTIPGKRWKPGRRIASVASLMAWADAHGRAISPERLVDQRSVSSGGEHLVFFDEESGRAVKITKPGVVGMQGEDAGAYIQRWKLANEAFGDDVAIEGIVTLPGEHAPRVVTSQPWRVGRDATDAEIRDYLVQKGFHEHDGRWIHPIRRIKIWDTITPGNVIITENGPMAVDLQAEPASTEDVQAVREETGIGRESAFSMATTTGDFFPNAEVVQKGVSSEDLAELQRRLNATPIGRALLEGALIVPDRTSLDGKAGRPGQHSYSAKDWEKMEHAEGFHDPRKGGVAAAVFLNNVEVRRGETPLEALGRVLSHERMGHKEFNKLLKAEPKLAERWKLLASRIPTEHLDGLQQRYKDADGREEAPSLEWFADRAGALDSRAQLQPGSLLDQMWQTVSDVFRTILEPLSRDHSKKMSQEALDAHVRAFLRRMRKNMLEEAKRRSASINGNAGRGTLLSAVNSGRGAAGEGAPIAIIQNGSEQSELNFSMPGKEVWATTLGAKAKNLAVFEHVRKNKRALINDPNEQTRYAKQKAFVNELYDKTGGSKAYTSRFTDKSKPILVLSMPSTSRANKLPLNLARRLQEDFKVEMLNGDSIFGRDTDIQAKDAETYLEKMTLPAYAIVDPTLAERLKGKRIILVDDLITTGDSGEALRMALMSMGLDVDSMAVLGTSPSAIPATDSVKKTLHNELNRQLQSAPTLPAEVKELLHQKSGLTNLIQEAHGRSLNSLLKKAQDDANSSQGAIAVVEAMMKRRDAWKKAASAQQ